ncbi:MAG: ABC transporter substrate-binding protein, partial [Bacteroidetes bacterium]|nr:ABC transporter substrate-binding protein [Bacteroidota bacterium]
MRKINFVLALLGFILVHSSCENKKEPEKKIEIKGDVNYGGTFHFRSPEKIETFNPLEGTNLYTRNITYQIFETLLRTDLNTTRTVPHLAKTCEVDETGKYYTLTIRDDVYFHPDPCFGDQPRKLTVKDVKFSLELACSNLAINKMAYLLVSKIKGARTFFMNSKSNLPFSGISGIKIVDSTTLTIELIAPYFGFKEILAHANLGMMAPEVYQTYKDQIGDHPIGTGPFRLKENKPELLVLERSENYWRKDSHGNQLPYLDKVVMTYSNNKKKELSDFQKGKIDCVLDIPVDQINFLLGSLQDAQKGQNVPHRVLSGPSMSVMYMGFACESKEFRDPRVRQAFNLAVDRTEIVNNNMGGEGWPSVNGFIPPLDFYPNDDVESIIVDVEKAKQLLAAAGYPNGRNFPPLEIWVNAPEGTPNYKMAEGFMNQINEKLNLKLSIRICNISERDQAIGDGRAKIWRAGWIADYPNPETFLSLFYSGNIGKRNTTINSFRFVNREFDQILNQAIKESDEIVRNQLYVLCDQIIVDQAVVVPVL